jgi:pyridoxine/pyridoxamine 5'-phosphate oxidase
VVGRCDLPLTKLCQQFWRSSALEAERLRALLQPARGLEFWQGRAARLHDRFR